MANEETLFKEALAAIDADNLVRARDLLTRLLKANQGDPRYWLYMSAVVETQRETIFCLQKVLALEPQNASARRGLVMLGEMAPDPRDALPYKLQKRNWQAAMPGYSTIDKLVISGAWKPVVMAIAGIVLAMVILAWFLGSILKPTPQSAPAATPPAVTQPLPAILNTPEPGTRGELPPLMGPTPLVMLLMATYTPTPVYINTPHPRSETFRSAMRALQRGEFDSALTKLQEVAAIEPDAPDVVYYIGETYRRMGDSTKASKAYAQALEMNKDFAPAYLGRARMRLDVSFETNWKTARTDLQKAVELDPNLTEAWLQLADLDLQRGEVQPARQSLEHVAQLTPDSPLLYFYAARAGIAEGNLEQAIADARRAIELDATLLPAYRALGEAYYHAGKLEDALWSLRTYTVYETADVEAWLWLGEAYAGYGAHGAALEAFSAALNADPKSDKAFSARGELYLEDKQYSQAEADFTTALNLKAANFNATIGLARAQLAQGNNNLAVYNLDKAEGYAASDNDRSALYYWRAQGLEKMGEIGAARRDFQALLDLPMPNVPGEWLAFARLHLEAMRSPAAIIEATNAPTTMPTAGPTRKPTLTRAPTATLKPTRTIPPTATHKPTPTTGSKS